MPHPQGQVAPGCALPSCVCYVLLVGMVQKPSARPPASTPPSYYPCSRAHGCLHGPNKAPRTTAERCWALGLATVLSSHSKAEDPQPWPNACCLPALLCSLGKGRALNWQRAPCPNSPLHLPKAPEPSFLLSPHCHPPVPHRPLPVREGLPLLWVNRDRWGRRQQVQSQTHKAKRFPKPLCPCWRS